MFSVLNAEYGWLLAACKLSMSCNLVSRQAHTQQLRVIIQKIRFQNTAMKAKKAMLTTLIQCRESGAHLHSLPYNLGHCNVQNF